MASHHLYSRLAVRGPVSVAVGVAAAAIAIPLLDWVAGLLVGWTALAFVNVVWLLVALWPMDAESTRSHATAEDPGRTVARAISLIGSVASLGAVIAVLVRSHSDPATAFAIAAVAIAAVTFSWALIQVDYMLRYAHRYYSRVEDGARGGIDWLRFRGRGGEGRRVDATLAHVAGAALIAGRLSERISMFWKFSDSFSPR